MYMHAHGHEPKLKTISNRFFGWNVTLIDILVYKNNNDK